MIIEMSPRSGDWIVKSFISYCPVTPWVVHNLAPRVPNQFLGPVGFVSLFYLNLILIIAVFLGAMFIFFIIKKRKNEK